MADSRIIPTTNDVIHATDITNNYYTKDNIDFRFKFTKIRYMELGTLSGLNSSWKHVEFSFTETFNNPYTLGLYLTQDYTYKRFEFSAVAGTILNHKTGISIYFDQNGNAAEYNGYKVFAIVGDLA